MDTYPETESRDLQRRHQAEDKLCMTQQNLWKQPFFLTARQFILSNEYKNKIVASASVQAKTMESAKDMIGLC